MHSTTPMPGRVIQLANGSVPCVAFVRGLKNQLISCLFAQRSRLQAIRQLKERYRAWGVELGNGSIPRIVCSAQCDVLGVWRGSRRGRGAVWASTGGEARGRRFPPEGVRIRPTYVARMQKLLLAQHELNIVGIFQQQFRSIGADLHGKRSHEGRNACLGVLFFESHAGCG
jgi:hypothetical protein